MINRQIVLAEHRRTSKAGRSPRLQVLKRIGKNWKRWACLFLYFIFVPAIPAPPCQPLPASPDQSSLFHSIHIIHSIPFHSILFFFVFNDTPPYKHPYDNPMAEICSLWVSSSCLCFLFNFHNILQSKLKEKDEETVDFKRELEENKKIQEETKVSSMRTEIPWRVVMQGKLIQSKVIILLFFIFIFIML